MSAHVDVLAALSGAATECESRACRNHPDRAPYEVTAEMAESARATFLGMESELREARAAFAEAIGALEHGRSTLATALRHAAPDLFETDDDVNEHLAIKRMDAALARAKGGAA